MSTKMFDLQGKVAIVVGSTRGIGRGFAEALAEFGAKVIITGTNYEVANKVADEIAAKYNVETLGLELDIGITESVVSAYNNVINHFNSLDISVNNAGITITKSAELVTDDEWDNIMNVNLKGLYRCCREAGKIMLKSCKGSIINTASISAHITNLPQKQAPYNISKAGVIMLTKNLASEWAAYNIRVNSISPAYIKTEMNLREDVKKLHPEWCRMTPMGRLGEVDELKGAVVYLASDASSYTTGADIVVDGGYLLW